MIDRERLQEMLHIAPFHRWLVRIPTIARMYSDLMPRSVPL